MLERLCNDTGTHSAPNALWLAAGLLLPAMLTGSAVGAEQAGKYAAARANSLLVTNGDLATGIDNLKDISGFNVRFPN